MSDQLDMISGHMFRVLQSPEAQKIDFTFGSIKVDGAGLMTVVTSLMLGTLHIAVTTDLPDNAEAAYKANGNVFLFPDYHYGATPAQESAIVHESVHAMQDINYGYDFSRGDYFTSQSENEGAAYVARALYEIYRKSDIKHIASVYPAAKALADKIKDTPGAILSAQDVLNLRDVIARDPGYLHRMSLGEDTYSDGAWQ